MTGRQKSPAKKKAAKGGRTTVAKPVKKIVRAAAPKPVVTRAQYKRQVGAHERELAAAEALKLGRTSRASSPVPRSLPPLETNAQPSPAPTAGDRFVRIAFAPLDPENDSPMLLDCRLSPSGRIVGEWPLFGLWGSSETPDDLSPFLLNAEGSLDFGMVDEPENEIWRWCPTNLRDRALVKGELVTVRRADDARQTRDCTYRVRLVAVVGEGEAT